MFLRYAGTLRFRLAVLSSLIFALAWGALCLTILAARERDLRAQFDARMEDRGNVIAGILAERLAQSGSSHAVAPGRTPGVNSLWFPGYYVQVRLADGAVVERSESLQDRELPLTDKAKSAVDSPAPVFETLFEIVNDDFPGKPRPMRLMTVYHVRNETPFYLQIGASTAEPERSITRLRRLLLPTIPLGLVLSGVASWVAGGRALAPLSGIRDVAKRLSAHDLAARFEQPRGRDEVALMIATLNRMLARLAEAFESQGRFLAGAAHELKTPLAVMLGEAQVLLQQERDPEVYKHFVVSAQEEVRSLSQIVDSLLTLARAEAGAPLTEVADVSLNEVVTDAVERCMPLAARRQVRLVPVLALGQPDEAEPTLTGDGSLLTIMFANLIRNAVRHSPPGEVVDVSVVLADTKAEVRVRDRGPGIPPQYIDRVFDRFFRVPEGKPGFEGAGLGLTIVRGVARLHGGSVYAANDPERGCEFTVSLPLCPLS